MLQTIMRERSYERACEDSDSDALVLELWKNGILYAFVTVLSIVY